MYKNTSLWIYWIGPEGEPVRECDVKSIEEIHKISELLSSLKQGAKLMPALLDLRPM